MLLEALNISGTLISQLEVDNLVSMIAIDIQRSKVTIIYLRILDALKCVWCDDD